MPDFSSPISQNNDDNKNNKDNNLNNENKQPADDLAQLQKKEGVNRKTRKKYDQKIKEEKANEQKKLAHYARMQSTKQRFNFDNLKLFLKIILVLIIFIGLIFGAKKLIDNQLDKTLTISELENNLEALDFKASTEMEAKANNPILLLSSDEQYILARYNVEKNSVMLNGRRTKRDCKITLKVSVDDTILDLNPIVGNGTLIKCQPKKLPRVNF